MRDLPNSPEAEQAVLGILLSKQQQSPRDIAGLTDEDFYRSSHQILFKAIAGLYRLGKTADMVTVTESLRSAGKLEAVGGIAFITSLVGNVLSLQNLDEYIAVLQEKRRLRHLARTFDELAKEACRGSTSVENLLAQCRQAVNNVKALEKPIPFESDFPKKCHSSLVKPVIVPTVSDFRMLICKSAASFVGDPAVELFVIYSFGLCSCSEMNVCLQENLSQRGIDLEMMKNPRIFLSDAVLSLPDLFASLCYLHQTEGERSTVVLLDSWLLFQANTMSPVKIARAISQLRKLAENLDLKIILAVHTPSTDDFPKMGIMC